MAHGRTVAVLAAEGVVGRVLADGLERRGLPVARDDASHAGAIVDAGMVGEAPQISELATCGADAWRHGAEEPLRRALHVLQRAHRCLAAEGGRVVVLLPSLVTSGAAGVVPWVAAAEGYRALTKATARAWGSEGITVNCVLIPAQLVAGASLDRPGLQPPALGRPVNVMSDVVPVVASLLVDEIGAVTGQTFAADGGVWMTP